MQANGFDFQLQDRGGLGHEKLMEARNQLLGMAMKNPKLIAVRPNGQDDSPQFKLDIDDVRAGALGVSLADINSVLATAWGSSYVNDFIQNGRVKKVYLQSDAKYRMLPEDINSWYVSNKSGEMVPFSAFSTARWQYGSPRLERYNGIPSVEIMGQAAPGVSTGEAMTEMEKMAAQLPPGIGYEWTGLSYEEKTGRSTGSGALCHLTPGGVSLRGGTVRELDHSLCQPADAAAGPGGSGYCGYAAGVAQRCLSPDRSAYHRGAFHQERHPDHPVHQGAAASGT